MSKSRFVFRNGVGCLALLVLAACQTQQAPADTEPAGLAMTALDRYVQAPDPNYTYTLAGTIEGDGYTTYVLDMISQAWLTDKEIDRPRWRHWLVIVRPDQVETPRGLLIIGGGDNDDDLPTHPNGLDVRLALATQSIVGRLFMVPNQPLTFVADETRPRKEDETIAYTWDKYLRTGDDKWPLRLPMTKSAVRAMDTMTSFTASQDGGGVAVEKFVVMGGSKRGWTTWTTAAVDHRVIAIMPVVIDLLHIEPSFKHHYEVYGRYAEAVQDYVDMGVVLWQGTPEYRHLMEIVEPYEYRARLTLPKYLLHATGDQFFLPDSWQFYYEDLVGATYMRYVPNADHGLGGTDVGESIAAWYHAIVHNVAPPRFSWRVEDDGTIRVLTLDEPLEVRLWQASNPEARDFRKQTIGAAWTSTVLSEEEERVYLSRAPVPEQGWTAYMVEMTYPSGLEVPFTFTTGVKVVPETKLYSFEYATDQDRARLPDHR